MDWILFLTAWMTVLTAAICALTIAVAIYAKRTLRAARASLDFFSNPVVNIEGERNPPGPYGGDNLEPQYRITPHALLTLCNYSPMEIILPPPLAACRILPDQSSNPARAANFNVQSVQRSAGYPLPQEPCVVANTLPLLITLRGPPVSKGEPPLKLVMEFKVESYFYRGKTYGPLIAICTFLIEPQ